MGAGETVTTVGDPTWSQHHYHHVEGDGDRRNGVLKEENFREYIPDISGTDRIK